jgi:protocatechuate 3,4-dioxygenase alpha subunit
MQFRRDVLLKIWQANAEGRYNHPADRQEKPLGQGVPGWGRGCSDFETGLYSFETIKPDPVEGENGHPMAPQVNFRVVARCIIIGLNTRTYFSDKSWANTKDGCST